MRNSVKLITAILLATSVATAQVPVTVWNQKKVKGFNQDQMDRLYYSAVEIARREYKRIGQPTFVLQLGADRPMMRTEGKETIVYLKDWSRESQLAFTYAVIALAYARGFDEQQAVKYATDALTWAESIVDVKELKK